MLDAIETYLALRRATGFAMSTAEYLLKSFVAFAAERMAAGPRSAGTDIGWHRRWPKAAICARNRNGHKPTVDQATRRAKTYRCQTRTISRGVLFAHINSVRIAVKIAAMHHAPDKCDRSIGDFDPYQPTVNRCAAGVIHQFSYSGRMRR